MVNVIWQYLTKMLHFPAGENILDKYKADSALLERLAQYRMPFGKYKGRLLIDLPEAYVIWFANRGFPQGELGQMLGLTHEIKINGLEYLFDPLRNSDI